MAMHPGARIGAYEILALLGAGGMGEVYRARDTRLGREVAIKVLPDAFGADAERLARFEREARVLASLNHPGIAHLYGFEAAALEDGRSGHLLVMELAPGEDLSERVKRGPIPLDETLAIARQIAEALEEAHEKGIVHRDFKPANVKLMPDGKVKVLDFGLARAYSSDPDRSGTGELSQSPTLAYAGTMAGMILGTAAYMSPEQARGRPLDKRADIWAFGVVIFEMLTGTRLFQGETVSDTLAAVLRQEVDWSALPKSTPPRVRRLLAQCLERDPRKRLRDIGDARLAIEEALSGPQDETNARTAQATQGRRAGAGGMAFAMLGLGLALGLGAGWTLIRRSTAMPTSPGARWALAIPDGLTLSTAELPQVALSRDGSLQIVVVVDQSSTPRLLMRRSDAFEARLLPDTERAAAPFLSPDGAWVAFFRENALFKIPVAGGPPVRLARVSGQIRGGSWSRDGFIYIAPDTNVSISRVSENGGDLQEVTHLEVGRDERTHRWPHSLPDGSALLFTTDTQASTEYYDDARIEAVRPSTGERKVLLEGSSQAWYSPSGHLVFARGGSLFAVPLDVRSLQIQGSPIQVVQGVATDVGSGAVQFALAQNGAALWTPGGNTASYELVFVDRSGAETGAPIPPAPYNELALSPDGRQLALVGGQGGIADLWVADLERGGLTRLTFGEYVASPVWSPDGSRIAYGTRIQGRNDNMWQISWKQSDGSRDAEVLFEGQRAHAPTSFSPDGRTLIFDALSADAAARDIWRLPLDGPHRPVLLVGGAFMKAEGVISPDGRWLAYVSNEGGRASVFTRPYPVGEGRWQVSTPTGVEPHWSPNGRELFYRADAVLYRVPIDTSKGFSAGRPERIVDRLASGSGVRTYSSTPDGSRFMTFRSSDRRSSLRTLYFDLGFSSRLESLAAQK